MRDPLAARSFLVGEVEALEPLDFVAGSPVGQPLHAIEITRREDHGLEVRVPGRPPIIPELPISVRSALRERGFASEDASDATKPWVHAVGDAAGAVDLALRILGEVFGEKPDAALDVAHGSHRPEHEVRRKIAAARERIERVLVAMSGRRPEQDADGDYVIAVGDVHVVVAPRALPGGPALVRVFAIANVGVHVTPELGLFLARLNFGLAFGRFALDAEHSAIWLDETLLGEEFSDEQLRFTIEVVASTADQWDDRLKHMFGGVTYQEVLAGRSQLAPPRTKPGEGGYL
jgi:hypothetical protein